MPKVDSLGEGWLKRFRDFMVERRYSRYAIKAYCIVVRAFLRFLDARHVTLASALPSHIDSYLKVQRSRYRRRWGHEPHDAGSWRTYHTSPIHLLFYSAQGQWPPRSKVRSDLASFRSHLEAVGHSRHSVGAYLTVAHRFLTFLAQRDVAPDRAQPADVSAYLKEEYRRYRRRHGRPPRSVVIWRCSLTSGVHALLRHAQGQWPPPLSIPWLERFKAHMRETCPSPGIREHYACAAGQFLAFILKQGIAIDEVESGHIEAFCRCKLTEYRKRHGRDPAPVVRWLSNTRTPDPPAAPPGARRMASCPT